MNRIAAPTPRPRSSAARCLRSCALLAFALCAAAATPARAEDAWRLDRAVHAPAWLRLEGEHRLRVEWLPNDFRTAAGGDTLLALRTRLVARADWPAAGAIVEVLDARAFSATGAHRDTFNTNPLDLLQASVVLRALKADGAPRMALTVGRFTLDVGSRRLVARNNFRNTINAFTGLHALLVGAGQNRAQVFAVFPVKRQPTDPAKLAAQRLELDAERLDSLLAGFVLASGLPERPEQFELASFMFFEHSASGELSRSLVTPDLHVWRKAEPGALSFDVELMPQLGSSTEPSSGTVGPHRALAVHADAAFTFRAPWHPRVGFALDYASGDAARDDAENNRFDPLFGARRFDLGPTGLYNALARSNLNAFGPTLAVDPAPSLHAMLSARLALLDSKEDAWVGTPWVAGGGGVIGWQVEAVATWQLLPGNLALEAGGALLAGGTVAPTRPAPYLYAQVTGQL